MPDFGIGLSPQDCKARFAGGIESELTFGQDVTPGTNEKPQLVPAVTAIAPVIPNRKEVLVVVDVTKAAITRQETNRGPRRSRPRPPSNASTTTAPSRKSEPIPFPHHQPKTSRCSSRSPIAQPPKPGARYRLRPQTVETVFGIIKAAHAFRRFLVRGLAKVSQEGSLVCDAYNLTHLHLPTTMIRPD